MENVSGKTSTGQLLDGLHPSGGLELCLVPVAATAVGKEGTHGEREQRGLVPQCIVHTRAPLGNEVQNS